MSMITAFGVTNEMIHRDGSIRDESNELRHRTNASGL